MKYGGVLKVSSTLGGVTKRKDGKHWSKRRIHCRRKLIENGNTIVSKLIKNVKAHLPNGP